jgi:plasmid stabilization system protein ParE
MEAINITAYTNDTSQIDAIKAVLKALKIKFEVATENPYNPEFVSKIQESREQYKKGNYAVIKTEDLWK